MLELSLVICAHNPRKDYLRRVLDGLRDQTLSNVRWELLLVDNASKVPLATEWDLSWHPNARHIAESELGKISAIRRGMREAIADLLVFVDDDNVLDPNYLCEAIRIKQEWPMLGTWGSGTIIPEFEVAPADHLRKYLHMLALRDVDSPRWSNVIPCAGARPWGAGQCMRANVAKAYQQYFNKTAIKLVGPKGESRRGMVSRHAQAGFMCGEDVEIGYVACQMGLGVGIFPELKLTHIIPKQRVEESYLIGLAEGIRASAVLLDYKWQNIYPESPFSGPLGLPRVLKNLIFLRGIRRRFYLAGLRGLLRARAIVLESKMREERHAP
jgi:hypothetical protein